MREATAAGLVVIPVGGPDGKRPTAGRGWQSRGLASDDELVAWSSRPGPCNYGIVTGGLVDVIDIDAGGDEGRAQELLRRLGKVLGLPAGWRTRTVATGRGVHLYIAHVPGARSADSIAGIPVEYKAGGRMVVGPGSLHLATGKRYTVVDPAVPIAALPDPARLLAALGAGHGDELDARGSGCRPIGPGGLSAPPRRHLTAPGGISAALALTRAEAAIAKAPQHERNATLNRRVYALGPYLAAGELTISTVRRVCGAAARRPRPDATPGLDALSVAATLTSAIDAGLRDTAPQQTVGSALAGPERACEESPAVVGVPSASGRKGFRPLTPWKNEEAVLAALALIWRAYQATAWNWHGWRLDRAVYDLLLGLAQKRCESIEVEPTIRYLMEHTGVHHTYIEASLGRLCEHGWLSLVRQGGPKGEHSPRAPSTFALAMPKALRSPPPCYPESMLRRLGEVFASFECAHQLQELPLQGSGLVLPARRLVRGEVSGPSQGVLAGLEVVGVPAGVVGDSVPVSAPPEVAGIGVRRATTTPVRRPKKSSSAHRHRPPGWSCARNVLEPELVAVLELLEVAGLAPEVVARLTRPEAYRRAQRRAGLAAEERPH